MKLNHLELAAMQIMLVTHSNVVVLWAYINLSSIRDLEIIKIST